MMLIGILATGTNEAGLLEQFGSFADMTRQMFERQTDRFSFRTFEVCSGELPDSVRQCDGWVVTGSPRSVYEALPWIASLEKFIREIDAIRQPLIGICFGHQIIARALGGKVEKAEAGWGLGCHRYQLTSQGQELIGTAEIDLHLIHQDQVLQCPDRAEKLAGSEFCPNGILRYENHILTVQAHPEFGREYMLALLPDICPEYISEDEASEGLLALQNLRARPDRLVQCFIELLST